MLKRSLFLFVFLPFFLCAQRQDLNYFLPDVTYDKNIPSPEDFLGFQVGEWHVSHDQMVAYMRELARLSDRVTIDEYARSYEQRPLQLLIITSQSNHQNLEQIRNDHLALSDPDKGKGISTKDMPVVVYEGFSVHGNEASAGNAAVLVAYYLAAGQGNAIESLLQESIILLDPCLNPDGFNRFASWVNSHKGKNPIADGDSRELNEAWPGGRTNHYWFDLNRDWLLLQHPESRGRIKNFHRWKPNILTDHHEMGSNSTFFFQPGIPSRTNPITPPKNQELTGKIAEFHAKALDEIGSLYYSQESFDDFYYGKGSTYPDANGCIGILFEQASARGHLHESTHGDLSFPFAVRNQVKTALSTLEGGQALRTELLDFQKSFYQSAMQEARKAGPKGYVFGEANDPARLDAFLSLLLQHQIETYTLNRPLSLSGKQFSPGSAYFVPLEQAQYRLVRAIFETTTTFRDSLFYDVSSWTLPLAFNLEYSALTASNWSGKMQGERLTELPDRTTATPGKSNYAYIFKWDNYYAPKALNQLLQAGLLAKVNHRDFSVDAAGRIQRIKAGSIMIPLENQVLPAKEVERLILQSLGDQQIEAIPASSGFTPTGIDLGSPSFSKVERPKVLLLVGQGVSSYDAGEVWHLLDQRMDIPVTLVESARLGRVELDDYNTIIMVNGSYSALRAKEDLKEWVQNGGTLIAMRGAINWASAQGLANVKMKTSKNKTDSSRRPYSKIGADQGAKFIGGAIFEVKLDLSHPLAYGFQRSLLPVFRRGTNFLEPTSNRYATPAQYTAQPLLSGYISDENLKLAQNSAAITVTRVGGGRVIAMVDNPNFRAFWYGTNKLFLNAIFFGRMIDGRTAETPPAKKKE